MLSPLCPGSWHHVQNPDSFFTKISFCALPGRRGTGGRETGMQWAGDLGAEESASSGKAHHASGLILDALPHVQLPPEEWLCLYPAGGWLPAGVRCLSQTPSSSPCLLSTACCFWASSAFPGNPGAQQDGLIRGGGLPGGWGRSPPSPQASSLHSLPSQTIHFHCHLHNLPSSLCGLQRSLCQPIKKPNKTWVAPQQSDLVRCYPTLIPVCPAVSDSWWGR